MKRKLRMGMVGGGLNSFIGPIHRSAIGIDGEIELVCGTFSSTATESKRTGAALYLHPERVYRNYAEMFEREKNLDSHTRIDFVSIVTPNHLHFEPCKLALENGFHVLIEKPLTFSLEEAKALRKIVQKTGMILGLAHTYTGYPLVKEARHLVAKGTLGKICKVYVEYTQGWLSAALKNNKQAAWRTDPARSGMGGAVGDIGTHAANLAEYITGSKISALCAMLNTHFNDRSLDDDSTMLIKFNNGASGVLLATQIATGEENNLNIRVYGDKGGLEWQQQDPNTMILKWLDKPEEIIRAGQSYLSKQAKEYIRTPAGHPEGYIEAFANIYKSFAKAVRDYNAGKNINVSDYDFPNIEEGVRGMNFIQTVVKSSKSPLKWTKLSE